MGATVLKILGKLSDLDQHKREFDRHKRDLDKLKPRLHKLAKRLAIEEKATAKKKPKRAPSRTRGE